MPAATDWRVRVYYCDNGGAVLAQDLSDADFEVTDESTPVSRGGPALSGPGRPISLLVT